MKKFLLLMIILLQSCDMKKNEIIEPRAEKINKIMTMHNHERIDEFYWLNERGNQKVIDYLNSENDYRNSYICLLYTSPSPRDRQKSRMPSSA